MGSFGEIAANACTHQPRLDRRQAFDQLFRVPAPMQVQPGARGERARALGVCRRVPQSHQRAGPQVVGFVEVGRDHQRDQLQPFGAGPGVFAAIGEPCRIDRHHVVRCNGRQRGRARTNREAQLRRQLAGLQDHRQFGWLLVADGQGVPAEVGHALPRFSRCFAAIAHQAQVPGAASDPRLATNEPARTQAVGQSIDAVPVEAPVLLPERPMYQVDVGNAHAGTVGDRRGQMARDQVAADPVERSAARLGGHHEHLAPGAVEHLAEDLLAPFIPGGCAIDVVQVPHENEQRFLREVSARDTDGDGGNGGDRQPGDDARRHCRATSPAHQGADERDGRSESDRAERRGRDQQRDREQVGPPWNRPGALQHRVACHPDPGPDPGDEGTRPGRDTGDGA